jgi:hypothetical protein
MPIFQTYFMGLAVAHFAWFYFFTTGQLLRPRVSDGADCISLSDLVISSVAGMALSGFGLLFLGFTGLLNGFGLFGALLLEGLLFWLLKGDNWLSWTFWRTTFHGFVKAWTSSAFFIYVLLLVLGIPAVLPPTFADSVTYHLAYAVDWANAGHIYVDPFLRFPYYANNFLLLYSALFILNLGNYCHFLTWLCGLLTCLGILAFFCPVKSDLAAARPLVRSHFYPQQFLIPLSVALCPVFLRYLNTAYVDVPIGLFLLVAVLCAYRTPSHRPFERELVVIAAFCAGMKLTLIGHLPFFIISLFVVSARRLRPRQIALLSVLLVALSLPWYARNLIAAHDPAPPIFNFYFNRPDPVFTKADANLYIGDTITDRRPLHLLLLPFQFFADPTSESFREWGISAMIVLLYAPILFLGVQPFFWQRWRTPHRLTYLSAAVTYLAFPWFFSSLGRYLLHWYPALAAWVGVVVSQVCVRADALWNSHLAIWTMRVATVALCGALIIPSLSLFTPASKRAPLWLYRDYYAATFDLSRLGGDRERYLKKHLPGYLASEAVIETLASEHKKQTRVLALGTQRLHFYFRKKANIVSVGDHFGPARYQDLFLELDDSDSCLPYLTRLDISAVIIPPFQKRRAWWERFYWKFWARLRQCGYKEYRCGEKDIAIFLRSDIKPSRRLDPVLD